MASPVPFKTASDAITGEPPPAPGPTLDSVISRLDTLEQAIRAVEKAVYGA